MRSGIIVLETVDPQASILRYLSGDKNSYIGIYYTNYEGIVLARMYETLSGLTPGWFPSYCKVEHLFNKTPFIKRIIYYEAKTDISNIVKDKIINKDDDINYKYLLEHLIINNQLSIMSVFSTSIKTNWCSGYKFVNEILANIMNISIEECNNNGIISNNVLSKPVKMVNDVIQYDNNIVFTRLFSLARIFVELYINNDNFKNCLDKKFSIVETNKQPIENELYNLKENIRKLYNIIRSEDKTPFNFTTLISNYNDLVKKLGLGSLFDEDILPISSNINMYTQGTLDIYAYIPKDIKTKTNITIYDHNNLSMNSEIDDNVIVPIFANVEELSNYSSQDLNNILLLVNALNVGDNRFAYLQNNIIDILSKR